MTPGSVAGCICEMLVATDALRTMGVVVEVVAAVEGFVGFASSLRISAVEDGVSRFGTSVGELIEEVV